MERVVRITKDEYLCLGDAGAWVYAARDHSPSCSYTPDNASPHLWEHEKTNTNTGKYRFFYTKVSDDG